MLNQKMLLLKVKDEVIPRVYDLQGKGLSWDLWPSVASSRGDADIDSCGVVVRTFPLGTLQQTLVGIGSPVRSTLVVQPLWALASLEAATGELQNFSFVLHLIGLIAFSCSCSHSGSFLRASHLGAVEQAEVLVGSTV